MAGTVTGGRKAAQKNKANNPNFYADIGRAGGLARVPKGFALQTPEQRSAAGKKGVESRRRIKLSQQNATMDSSSDSSTTKPGQKPASDTKQANAKPSRRMSSYLGKFRGAWRG